MAERLEAAGSPHAREIVLLTESDGFFGQKLMPWESMDIGRIVEILSRHFTVRRATYADVANGKTVLNNATIVHASSQQPEYKAFIEDVLLYLHASGNRLVPSIHMVRSHENKGYQELHKRLRGIEALPARYVAKLSELDRTALKFPAVFKSVSGFGSAGVELIGTEPALRRAAEPGSAVTLRQVPKLIRSRVGQFVRKYLLGQANLRPYGNYYRPLKRFVLQQFLPGLTYDFKVLAYQERVFVLKRSTLQGDFRASGSGRFAFEDPPEGLLDYVRRLLLQFDEPYVSLDVCFDGSAFHLVEFQGVHFGPYTLMKAPKHYVWDGVKWTVENKTVNLEEVTAESLVRYLLRTPAGTRLAH